MKVVVAPDKFKGSLSAEQSSEAIAVGVKRALPEAEIVRVPVSDGGEGMLETILSAMEGRLVRTAVTGSLGEPLLAGYGILNDGTAVIETAQAAGLWRVPEAKRNPLIATTYGVGEIIVDALEAGCRRFIIGIGGSATCDAGIGMAQAMGVGVYGNDGLTIGFGGGRLVEIERIDLSGIDRRIRESSFVVASDVDNPLYGDLGAAKMFAPQKGANEDDVELLDRGLIRFAEVVRRDLGIDIAAAPGAGAAGGLGAGLIVFLGAVLRSGIELIADITGLREKVLGASLVITGEGQADAQSAHGKAPVGVAQIARESGVRCALIAGRLGEGYEQLAEYGITDIRSLEEIAGSADTAMKNASAYLELVAEQIAMDILIG